MICDKLFELAFAYRKTKLWEFLSDTDLFAVKLTNDRIGYISIMGAAGELCAVGLYIGEEGFNSYRAIAKAGQFFLPAFEMQEHVLRQSCLQCAFENRDALSEEEREEVKKYARAHGIKIAGKNAYPQFAKYQPYRFPWHLQTQEEQDDLCEGLMAALEIARLLKELPASALGIKRMSDEIKEVPMLVRQEDSYVLEKTNIPEEKEEKWPVPEAFNDINIAKIKKIPKSGVWECEILRLPEPVKEPGDEVPYFPVIFLAVDNSTDYILPVSPVLHYEQKPEELLNLFMEALLMVGACPTEMKLRDKRSYIFVKGFCEKLKISVSLEEDLPALDNAEYYIMDRLDNDDEDKLDDMAAMLDELLEMDARQLQELPAGMLKQLELLVGQGAFPKEIEKKFKRLFQLEGAEDANLPRLVKSDKGKTKTRTKASADGSYVISVSLYAGCYRHIQISAAATLFDLHCAILDAFEFDDDHAHAFFMDNKKWSDWDSYYAEGIEEGLRTTQRHKLNRAGLCKGKQFKYIFDFGDEWTFQCKVLKEMEEKTDKPVVVKSKGEAPPQYAGWEDEWEEDNE